VIPIYKQLILIQCEAAQEERHGLKDSRLKHEELWNQVLCVALCTLGRPAYSNTNCNCTLHQVPRHYIIVSQPPLSKMLLDKLMAAQPALLWILKIHRLIYVSTLIEPVLRQDKDAF